VPFVTGSGIGSADIELSVHILLSTVLVVSLSFWESGAVIKSALLAQSSSCFPSFHLADSRLEHTALLALTSELPHSSESVVSLSLNSTVTFITSDAILFSHRYGFSRNTEISRVMASSSAPSPASNLSGSALCDQSITFAASDVFDATEPFLSTWLLSETSVFSESDDLIISDGQETSKGSTGTAIVGIGIGIGLLVAACIVVALLWRKRQQNQSKASVYDVDAEFQEEKQEADSDEDAMDLDAVDMDVNGSQFSADAEEEMFRLWA
jgi:hypothetical protein